MTFVVRKTIPAKDQRADLMAIVCPEGACHWCGAKPDDPTDLQFDHVGTRAWEPARVNQGTRLRLYYREWQAAGGVVGKGVVGACEACNESRGGQRSNDSSAPGGRPVKRRGQGPKWKAKRARGGQGYTRRAGYAAHVAAEMERARERRWINAVVIYREAMAEWTRALEASACEAAA